MKEEFEDKYPIAAIVVTPLKSLVALIEHILPKPHIYIENIPKKDTVIETKKYKPTTPATNFNFKLNQHLPLGDNHTPHFVMRVKLNSGKLIAYVEDYDLPLCKPTK